MSDENKAVEETHFQVKPGEMSRSASITKLATALVQAQGEIEAAGKDAKNSHFGNTYATLASVVAACRGPLAKAGICWLQPASVRENGLVVVTTVLIHAASGEWVASELAMKAMKPDPQGIGSTITYARRYGLSSTVGIVADDDDDGNAASGRAPAAAPERRESAPAPKTSGSAKVTLDAAQEAAKNAILAATTVREIMTASEELAPTMKTWPQEVRDYLFHEVYTPHKRKLQAAG